jgi:Na+/H+ antiporter NhaC
MKRVLYLVMVALVAMLILAPTAMAQETTAAKQKVEQKVETTVEKDLPKSGGAPVGSILLPAAALLVGGGIVGYVVLRRR